MPSVTVITPPANNTSMPPVLSGRYSVLPGGVGGAKVQVTFTLQGTAGGTPSDATLDATGPGTWQVNKPNPLTPGVYTAAVALFMTGNPLAVASATVTGLTV